MPVSISESCPVGWTHKVAADRCYLLQDTTKTPSQAVTACAALHVSSRLAEIRSAAQQQAIAEVQGN